MGASACNSSTQEAEAGGLWVRGHRQDTVLARPPKSNDYYWCWTETVILKSMQIINNSTVQGAKYWYMTQRVWTLNVLHPIKKPFTKKKVKITIYAI
jgi:hypothetical protein